MITSVAIVIVIVIVLLLLLIIVIIILIIMEGIRPRGCVSACVSVEGSRTRHESKSDSSTNRARTKVVLV